MTGIPSNAWHVFAELPARNAKRGARWEFLTWVSGALSYERALEVAREGTNSYRRLAAFMPSRVRPS